VTGTAEKILVGIAAMQLSRDPNAVIITHGLGSCIGVAIYDPVAQVGGLLHYMLPEVDQLQEKAAVTPLKFGETGIPHLFHAAYAIGAVKSRIIVKIAGGASLLDAGGMFNIGKRNFLLARKLMWKNGMTIAAEEVGDHMSRTMELEIDTGRVWITSPGRGKTELGK
jgi:chemotaxis protein CheD